MCAAKNRSSIITDQVDQDLETACSIIKEEGYQNIELHNVFGKSIEECNKEEVQAIQEIVQRYELKVVNLAATIFFLCPLYEHYRVSSFNPEFHAIEGNVEHHLTMLRQACEIANALHCERIRVFPFRIPDNEEVVVVGTKQDQQKIMENFRKAIVIAKEYDITLAVENCPYSHCPKGEMTAGMIRELKDDHIQLLWDPANSYRAEKFRVPEEYLTRSLEEEYALIKDDITHVHVKNYTYDETLEKPFDHKALLQGDIDYHTLLPRLVKDVDAYISLEPEVSHEETLQSMRELRTVLGDVL